MLAVAAAGYWAAEGTGPKACGVLPGDESDDEITRDHPRLPEITRDHPRLGDESDDEIDRLARGTAAFSRCSEQCMRGQMELGRSDLNTASWAKVSSLLVDN